MTDFDDGVRFFENSEPVLLSEALHDQLNLNYEKFKELLQLGAIYVESDRQTKDRWILENSLLRVHTKPRRYMCDYPWRSLIVFQNESFVVLNKPSGVPSHPLADNVFEDAMTQTSLALKMPLYVTHRLDRLTSGLIVYGKKRQFVKDFNQQLMHRQIQKKYVALVEGAKTLPDRLTHSMNPEPGTPKKLAKDLVDGWDLCQLEILEQKKISENTTWVKINLLTGRTHQIRAQMAAVNAPILGDVLYGSKTSFLENAIALRSCEIAFNFQGERVQFELGQDLSFDLSYFI
jgi:23S rRNA pseudouridine1911/1915/1917 synthase